MSLRSRGTLDPAESLTSHYWRTLRACDLQPSDLAKVSKARVNWHGPCVFAPEAQLLRAWARLTAQPIELLRASTMSRFSQGVPEIKSVTVRALSLRQAARKTWIWRSSTQACLSCLAEAPQIWKLEWRLPWVFDCPRHDILLRSHCPSCSRILEEQHPCLRHDLPPQLEITMPSPELTSARSSSRRIRNALHGEPQLILGTVVQPSDYLNSLRGLAGLIEHLERLQQGATGTRRAVVAAPRGAAARARLLCAADDLLQEPEGRTRQRLNSLVQLVPVTPAGLPTWLRDHSLLTSTTGPVLASLSSRRCSIGRQRRDVTIDGRNIPQLIWAEDWILLRQYTASSESTGRGFASLALLKMATGSTWSVVGASLGFSTDVARHLARQGKAELTDESAFIDYLVRTSPTEQLDWRSREQQAWAVMHDVGSLQDLAAVLASPHLDLLVLRERLWAEWALGHPAILKQTWPTQPRDRARLASQRRRWSAKQSQSLANWMNALHVTASPRPPCPPRARLSETKRAPMRLDRR